MTGNYRTRKVTRHSVTHEAWRTNDDYEYRVRYVKSFDNQLNAARWLAKRQLQEILIQAHNPIEKEDWSKAFASIFPTDDECECCQVKVIIQGEDDPHMNGSWEWTGELKAWCMLKRRAYLKASVESILKEWNSKP